MDDINIQRERTTVNINIYNMDCIKGMQELPKGSVDIIITDPPYGIDYTNTKGVGIINDKRPYIWFLSEAYRVLRNNSACLVFCRWDVQQDFKRAMELAGFKVKNQIVWDKCSHGMGDTKGSFAPAHELIIFGVKGRYIFPDKRPKDVIRVPKVPSNHQQHPNEKPVELIKQLVEATTLPNEIVLDPFMGSGTTAVACENTGRRCLGYELDEAHYKTTCRRLACK